MKSARFGAYGLVKRTQLTGQAEAQKALANLVNRTPSGRQRRRKVNHELCNV